ncbi:MAG: ATPase [Clostridium perfringens]|nr:ATPase [Clostridium perfringens]
MSNGYYIMELVDDIANVIDTASKVPMTGKVMLDKREILDIIYSIEDSLPDEIRNAQWIINQKERILEEAAKEKEKMLYEAKRDSDNLRQETLELMRNRVQNHDYVKEAKETAERIIAEANKEATAMIEGAKGYADSLLSDLEKEIEIKNKQLLNYMKATMEQFATGFTENFTNATDDIRNNIDKLRKED